MRSFIKTAVGAEVLGQRMPKIVLPVRPAGLVGLLVFIGVPGEISVQIFGDDLIGHDRFFGYPLEFLGRHRRRHP